MVWASQALPAASPGGDDALETINVLAGRDRDDVRLHAAPVTVIDGETIARSGVATIDEYLQRLPVFGFQGVNQNQNGGGYGASFVDLRNLNFNRTLVLVNGRRVVVSGITTDEAVDVANIPAALVDRIEVMPNGSEPRFGADAVAGVVNIVLKHDLTGFELAGGSSVSTDADGAGGDVAMAYGKDLGQGNLTLSGSWMKRDPLHQSDRAWARDPIDTAARAPNGTLVLTRGSAASLSGNPVFAGAATGAVTNGYDTSLASDLRGGLTRGTVNLLVDEDVATAVSVFAEVSYSDKVSNTSLPPQILGLSGTLKHPDGFVIPAADPFNPYGQAVTLQRVLAEVGDQATRSDNGLFRAVVGIDGQALSGIFWSLSVNHGESHTAYVTTNAVNLSRALATVSTDPADCPASQGCVPADYFGVGSLSPAAAAYLRYTNVTHAVYVENEFEGQLDRQFEVLSGAPWNVTLGAEYRREHGQTEPSSVVLAGDQAGPDSAPTSGGYASREVFLALDLPILSDQKFAETLRAESSARHVSTDLDGDFTVWKLDAEWVPGAGVKFRAGLGTARRVPAITEAFGGSTATALDVADPCDPANGLIGNGNVAANCRALGLGANFHQDSALINVDNGGNPHLRPEASRSLNAGIAFTPTAPAGSTFSADYYRIEVHDAIDSYADFNPNYIPDQCYASLRLSSPLCALIIRTLQGPSAGQISRILAPDENIGAIDTDGIDLGSRYQADLGACGLLRLDWHATVLLDYRVQEVPGGGFVQEAGSFPSVASAGSLTRFRSFFTAADDRGPWTLEWTLRYIGAARVLGLDPGAPFSSAPGIFYQDLALTRRFSGVTIDVGVDNLANQRPPTLIDGVTNTNVNTYDVVGRFLHLHATARF
jgi:outer membrane receptor protein involved in Fe transport